MIALQSVDHHPLGEVLEADTAGGRCAFVPVCGMLTICGCLDAFASAFVVVPFPFLREHVGLHELVNGSEFSC